MSKIVMLNKVNVLNITLPNHFKTKLSYIGTQNTLDEAYAALYLIKEEKGIPPTYFTSRGTRPLSRAWDDAFDLLCKPDGSKKTDILNITKSRLENLLIIHRLGLSLAMLEHLKIDRQCQVEKLTDKEFLKSEYVLYIGREFARKKYKVAFLKEKTYKTSDLLVNDKLHIECKSRDSDRNILQSFKKACRQVPKSGPGMICIDVPKGVRMDMEKTDHKIQQDLEKIMRNHGRINFCLLTQINLYNATSVGVENEISKILIEHPCSIKLRSDFPTPYDAFGQIVA